MSILTEGWVAQEKSSFKGFCKFVATRMTGDMGISIAETLRRQLLSESTAKVEVPWGTFKAEVKTIGESTNITPTFEPSKRFKEMLNSTQPGQRTADYQTQFDPNLIKIFQDYLAWGTVDPEKEGGPTKEKGAHVSDDDAAYFYDSFMRIMTSLAKDHQRDGKEFHLQVNDEFDHGEYVFEYHDDNIDVKFVPSKNFKQYLKNDNLAAA